LEAVQESAFVQSVFSQIRIAPIFGGATALTHATSKRRRSEVGQHDRQTHRNLGFLGVQMSAIVSKIVDGEWRYVVIDDSGRTVATFPDHNMGLREAAEYAIAKRWRGKIYILIPSSLPEGYAIFAVIDGDETYFLVAIPGGFLRGQYPTPAAARNAAYRKIESDNPPPPPSSPFKK
jgi:hypothetical protein